MLLFVSALKPSPRPSPKREREKTYLRFPATAVQSSASQPPQQAAKLFSPTEVFGVALVIFTKPGCPYCQQARDYYNSKGIAFTDYDAQNDRARRAEMFKFSGDDPTVPCIVENGKHVQSGWGDPLRG
jgi:glutaredoxin 3